MKGCSSIRDFPYTEIRKYFRIFDVCDNELIFNYEKNVAQLERMADKNHYKHGGRETAEISIV